MDIVNSADDLRYEFMLALVRAFAVDPAHRLQILDAMGLDVIPTHAVPSPFLVVRPRGEAS